MTHELEKYFSNTSEEEMDEPKPPRGASIGGRVMHSRPHPPPAKQSEKVNLTQSVF